MDTRLKDSEWIILRALWCGKQMDLRQIIAQAQAQNPSLNWDYKTYHSFLRILLDKGLIKAERHGRMNRYEAAISESDALSHEADSLLSRRAYYGSVSSLMVNMAERGKLTAAEKQELMALAQRLSSQED